MTAENTPKRRASQAKSCEKVLVEQFRGIPPGLLCNMVEVQSVLKIADEAWAALGRAGLPILLSAGRADIGWTTDIIEWAKSKPKVPTLASSVRKKRQRRRKTK